MSWIIRHKEEGLYLASGFPWWSRCQSNARRFRTKAAALYWARDSAHDMVEIRVIRLVPKRTSVTADTLRAEGADLERARLVQWLWDERGPLGTRVAGKQLAELVAKKEHHL